VIDCARHLAVKLKPLRAKVEIAQRLREQRRDAKNKL
jgi:hypothetical protein